MGKPETPEITKSCRVVLEETKTGQRYPAGEFELTEPEPGPTMEDFANAAFRASAASFRRLMPEAYRLIVLDGAREEAYGLTKWVKLIDTKSLDEDRMRKQPIHKRA